MTENDNQKSQSSHANPSLVIVKATSELHPRVCALDLSDRLESAQSFVTVLAETYVTEAFKTVGPKHVYGSSPALQSHKIFMLTDRKICCARSFPAPDIIKVRSVARSILLARARWQNSTKFRRRIGG